MPTLLLLSLLCQAPVTRAPPAPGTAPWVQQRLMNVDWLPYQGPVVRADGRVLRLQDDDFSRSFAVVPEAEALANRAQASFASGTRWLTLSMAVMAAGGAVMLAGALALPLATGSPARSLEPPLFMMGGGLITMLLGLVPTFLSVPHLQRAQNDFFSAIAVFNRGLLDVRPPVVVEP